MVLLIIILYYWKMYFPAKHFVKINGLLRVNATRRVKSVFSKINVSFYIIKVDANEWKKLG